MRVFHTPGMLIERHCTLLNRRYMPICSILFSSALHRWQ